MRRGLHGLLVGVGLTGFVLMGATGASAQEPAKPVLTLDGDAAMMTILIKPDKTGDFETVIAKYKEAFEKSDKAERKQQLAGLKFYKSSQQAQGNAIYIIIADPVVKDQEYDITRVVNEVFPSEVQEIFAKYKDAFAGRAIAPLSKVIK
jgi:hypothetical protein